MPQMMAQRWPMGHRTSWMMPRTHTFVFFSMMPTTMVPIPLARMQSTRARMPVGLRWTTGMAKKPPLEAEAAGAAIGAGSAFGAAALAGAFAAGVGGGLGGG